MELTISEESLQDLINIELGLFAPLNGFMGYSDFISVVDDMLLADKKTVWTIPITLDIDKCLYNQCHNGSVIHLVSDGLRCAELTVEDCFEINDRHLEKIFSTDNFNHPGVAREKARSPYRVGGRVKITDNSVINNSLSPQHTKEHFQKMGWQTVCGFQTKNPIHRAHEYLQVIALNVCDALFINPKTGWKRKGDFTKEAVFATYKKMISDFYPENRVFFSGLRTQMRYAGPREAVFDAIVRKNLGCTHFVIGRDHAGVGNFYGYYDGHKLINNLKKKHELGIEILLLKEPYYCSKCGSVVSNKSCAHEATHRTEISGTIVRDYLKNGKRPPERLMRPEIADVLMNLDKIFIE